MAKFTVAFLATTVMVAAGTMAAQEAPVGYRYQSAAGPIIAFIPSFAIGTPDIPAPRIHIPAELLAYSGDTEGALYKPAPLSTTDQPLGPRYQSPAGPEIAFIPSVESSPDMSLWLSTAAIPPQTQVGTVPSEAPADTGR